MAEDGQEWRRVVEGDWSCMSCSAVDDELIPHTRGIMKDVWCDKNNKE